MAWTKAGIKHRWGVHGAEAGTLVEGEVRILESCMYACGQHRHGYGLCRLGALAVAAAGAALSLGSQIHREHRIPHRFCRTLQGKARHRQRGSGEAEVGCFLAQLLLVRRLNARPSSS